MPLFPLTGEFHFPPEVTKNVPDYLKKAGMVKSSMFPGFVCTHSKRTVLSLRCCVNARFEVGLAVSHPYVAVRVLTRLQVNGD